MQFRVTCHSRSSGNWFTGAISEDLGVPKSAASLPRRVCLNDLHIVHRTVLGVCFHHSYSIHHSYTLAHTAKNGVLAVKPLSGSQGHKELAAVGVWPGIGHCENSSPWREKGREERVWITPIAPAWICNTSLGIKRSQTNHPTRQPSPQGRLSALAQALKTALPDGLIFLVFTYSVASIHDDPC